MPQDYDAHIRSGEDLGGDHYAHREYRYPDGHVIALPANASPPEGSVFIGVMEHHKKPDGEWCGGWVGFTNVVDPGKDGVVEEYRQKGNKHELVSEHPLTIAPSLQCRQCPSHGFIQNGRWTNAG